MSTLLAETGVSVHRTEPAARRLGNMHDDLVTYARTRDLALRSELAVRHLPLVKFVARKLANSLPAHFDLDDLVSWGSLGLLDALDKFNPGLDFRFSTYAVTRIRGAMLDGLQQMEWAPKQVTSRVRALRRLREAMTNELGYQPSVEQLALAMEVTPTEVRAMLLDDATTRMKPLEPAYGDDDDHHTDMADSSMWNQDTAAEMVELRHLMAVAVSALGKREQVVLTMYYRDGLTLRQVAEELGVSVSSATQTHTRLVESLRERLASLGGVTATTVRPRESQRR